MDPLTLALIAGGLGLAGFAKGEAIDKPKVRAAREAAAERSRYSPWTGYQSPNIKDADPIGQGLQYGFTGLQMGSNIGTANKYNDLIQKKIDNPNLFSSVSVGAPGMGGAGGVGGATQSYAATQSPWMFNAYA